MVRAEDEKEFARRFKEEHVDTKSAGSRGRESHRHIAVEP